MIAIEGKEA